MISVPDMDSIRAAIIAAFPDLADASFKVLEPGWDSTAVDIDDRLVFKFPRSESAERALRREAGLLAAIRPRVTMPVPDLALHSGPPVFSRHPKLRGDHLLAPQYERLPDEARQLLAGQIALFYAQIHGLDPQVMQAAGATPIKAWLPAEAILEKALPALPSGFRSWARETISAWQHLPPDPCGTTYGFFDGHGWNMAFDHANNRLNGIYDFADSGFGSLHQEFIYSNLISADLTARIVAAYEKLTARMLDRRRIALLTGVHRLSELAELADDPKHRPMMIRQVTSWAKRP